MENVCLILHPESSDSNGDDGQQEESFFQQNPLANVPLIVQKWRDDTNPSPNDCCALEEHAMNLNAAEEFI